MRSGDLDSLVAFYRDGEPVREGRSRVSPGAIPIAVNVPAHIIAGVGAERYASAENAATAPYVITIRKEPDVEELGAGHVMKDDLGKLYDISSVRPHPQDPRRDLEIAAVRRA